MDCSQLNPGDLVLMGDRKRREGVCRVEKRDSEYLYLDGLPRMPVGTGVSLNESFWVQRIATEDDVSAWRTRQAEEEERNARSLKDEQAVVKLQSQFPMGQIDFRPWTSKGRYEVRMTFDTLDELKSAVAKLRRS